MHTAGLQSNQYIPCFLTGCVNNLLLVNNTHCKTCEVIFINRVKIGHFCGFTAYQCTAGLHAPVSNAGYNGSNLFRVILAYCDIVKEKLRFRTTADNIIDTHCHAVNPDSVMLIHQERNFQFCSDSVRTRHKNRLFDSGQIRFKQTAKTADSGENAGNISSCNVFFHQSDSLITGGNINTSFFIAL